MEPIPDICILEGRNDWYTFKYFQEIILKDKNSYNFYPGAGATKLGDIIRLYLSWGKNFLVIIDGDNEGEEAKKKYIDELGILIEKRIFTLKDVLQISGATEKLIEDSDKQKICNEVFQLPSAKKKNFNLAINQLYANKKVIQISKTTSGRFKDTLAFIRKYFKNNEK